MKSTTCKLAFNALSSITDRSCRLFCDDVAPWTKSSPQRAQHPMRERGIRDHEGLIISALNGIFGSASMAGNKLSIGSEDIAGQSEATRLNGGTFVDATQKLGDRGDRLSAIAMHSATEAGLRKLDLIDFIPDSEGKSQIRIFQGRRVIVDDNLPVRAGTTDGQVYTTFLFGPGAFGRGTAPLDGTPLQGGFSALKKTPIQAGMVILSVVLVSCESASIENIYYSV